jgi:hypothetical protein
VNGKTNLGASVSTRLLNQAKQVGADYQTLLTTYCQERFLYRLGASDLSDCFVLKGAMLLRLWADQPYRATRDLDLLRRGDIAFAAIRGDLRAILATPVAPDAVSFDGDDIQVEAIRAEGEYAGVRATLPAKLGTARLLLQIDMGFGDVVSPAPALCEYPTLLDFPAPRVLAYPKEAVVAEKFEAMVMLGERNSRIKDFFDIYYLAGHFEFDRLVLGDALRQTFTRRGTPVPIHVPVALTPEYWKNPTRPAQVRAFSRRTGVAIADDFADEYARLLGEFLIPLLEDLRRGLSDSGTWSAGGPWR